jgi:hypothetical protein
MRTVPIEYYVLRNAGPTEDPIVGYLAGQPILGAVVDPWATAITTLGLHRDFEMGGSTSHRFVLANGSSSPGWSICRTTMSLRRALRLAEAIEPFGDRCAYHFKHGIRAFRFVGPPDGDLETWRQCRCLRSDSTEPSNARGGTHAERKVRPGPAARVKVAWET